MAVTKKDVETIAAYVNFMLDKAFEGNTISAGIIDICSATERLLNITAIDDKGNLAHHVAMRVAQMRGYVK